MIQDDTTTKLETTDQTPSSPLLLSPVDDTRKLVVFSASVVVVTTFLIMAFNFVSAKPGRTVLSVMMVLILIGIILAYKVSLKPAQIITTVSVYLAMTYFLYDGNGIHDASITAYISVVILSGLLLGEVGVIIFGILTTASLALIGYAEYFGWLQPTEYSGLFEPIDINLIWFLHFAVSVLLYYFVRRFSRLANEARESAKAFSITNKELSALRDTLQDRADKRTANLENQNVSLQAAARIAHQVLSAEDVTQLINMSAKLIASEFGYDHVGIFLLNERKDRAVLQAASSEGGKKMLAEHYELPTDNASVVGIVASEQHPRIVLDEGPDAVFFRNTYLPDMRSEMCIPMTIQGEAIGVLDVQSTQIEAFDQSNITIIQSLVNQLTLTIQNTRLVEEAQINLSQLELIVSEQNRDVWAKHLSQQSYGFVYTPLGVKTLRTAELDKDERIGVQNAEVPITLRGRKIGSISLQRLSRHWTKKEKNLLADVANQIGLAIENARLLSETREQANQDQLVSEVSSKLRETLDMDTVLKTALEEMKKTFNLKEVEVRLTPSNSEEVEA